MCGACTRPALAQPADKTSALVDLINHERVKQGRLPLARSAELDAAAQAHSLDMVQNNYLDHTGSDGSEPQERADRAGYHVPLHSAWIVVEAISAISGDPQGPVNWWLNDSPEVHGKVLMDPRWREVGAGYAAGGEYGNYWTALFACRPGIVPTVTLDGVSYSHTEECGDPAEAATLATTSAQPVATVQATATAQPTVLAQPTATAQPTLAPVVATTPSPRMTLQADAAARGSVVNVQWQGVAAPAATDWIGLYRPGDGDTQEISWLYVGCAQMPLDARPIGSCNMWLPTTLAPGMYEFRLLSANGYRRLAATPAFRLN